MQQNGSNMSEPTKIEKAISAIDTAKKIYQNLTKGVAELKDVDVRNTFVELKSALVDSKETILDIKGSLDAKDKEIKRLKEAFKLKESLVLHEHHGHYHKADENGNPYGAPYCSRCWEVDQKAVTVTRKNKCAECGAELWRAIPLDRKSSSNKNA